VVVIRGGCIRGGVYAVVVIRGGCIPRSCNAVVVCVVYTPVVVTR